MRITLKNFMTGKVSAQQVFNFVARKLIRQGSACVVPDGGCQYNGADGRHCAAGWLMRGIPAHDVAAMEGSAILGLIYGNWDGSSEATVQYPIAGPVQDTAQWHARADFMSSLQGAHDGCAERSGRFISEFKKRMLRVADYYHLDASVLADGARE